jgi:hypothetical protein
MVGKADKRSEAQTDSFEGAYPQISRWVKSHGWIEFGQIDGMSSFIIAMDEGGLVWEGKKKYRNLGEAFQALERGLSDWMKKQSVT